jgi:hypothetical protein
VPSPPYARARPSICHPDTRMPSPHQRSANLVAQSKGGSTATAMATLVCQRVVHVLLAPWLVRAGRHSSKLMYPSCTGRYTRVHRSLRMLLVDGRAEYGSHSVVLMRE